MKIGHLISVTSHVEILQMLQGESFCRELATLRNARYGELCAAKMRFDFLPNIIISITFKLYGGDNLSQQSGLLTQAGDHEYRCSCGCKISEFGAVALLAELPHSQTVLELCVRRLQDLIALKAWVIENGEKHVGPIEAQYKRLMAVAPVRGFPTFLDGNQLAFTELHAELWKLMQLHRDSKSQSQSRTAASIAPVTAEEARQELEDLIVLHAKVMKISDLGAIVTCNGPGFSISQISIVAALMHSVYRWGRSALLDGLAHLVPSGAPRNAAEGIMLLAIGTGQHSFIDHFYSKHVRESTQRSVAHCFLSFLSPLSLARVHYFSLSNVMFSMLLLLHLAVTRSPWAFEGWCPRAGQQWASLFRYTLFFIYADHKFPLLVRALTMISALLLSSYVQFSFHATRRVWLLLKICRKLNFNAWQLARGDQSATHQS